MNHRNSSASEIPGKFIRLSLKIIISANESKVEKTEQRAIAIRRGWRNSWRREFFHVSHNWTLRDENRARFREKSSGASFAPVFALTFRGEREKERERRDQFQAVATARIDVVTERRAVT